MSTVSTVSTVSNIVTGIYKVKYILFDGGFCSYYRKRGKTIISTWVILVLGIFSFKGFFGECPISGIGVLIVGYVS